MEGFQGGGFGGREIGGWAGVGKFRGLGNSGSQRQGGEIFRQPAPRRPNLQAASAKEANAKAAKFLCWPNLPLPTRVYPRLLTLAEEPKIGDSKYRIRLSRWLSRGTGDLAFLNIVSVGVP